MLSRRAFLLSLAGTACLSVCPTSIFAETAVSSMDNELSKEPRIPVNPNPSDIVNGPTIRKTQSVSYAQLSRMVGAAATASSVASAVAKHLGISALASLILKSISGAMKVISKGLAQASPSHGIQVTYNETARYYVNPATGHREYYETSYGLVSAGTY